MHFVKWAILGLAASTMMSECPPYDDDGSTHFPNGQYYFQSALLFQFDDVDYVTTFGGWTQGSGDAGDFSGQYMVLLWSNMAAYENGAAPVCTLYETMSATDHQVDSDPTVQYETCYGCDPFSDLTTVYWEDDGCPDDFMNIWYGGDWTTEMRVGYRHAAIYGWPAVFPDPEAWAAAGYEGVLYDNFLSPDVTNFAPHYYVKPEAWRLDGSQRAAHPPLQTMTLEHLSDLPRLLRQ